ncbi:ACP phosphodiesterase [Akkermansiaceae bacterium]|nr:ACP phosphodiesterase [Akkermansiaceae bacterium]
MSDGLTSWPLNFLAHFHLAERTDASQIGALLGDFVRGTPESLADRFPANLIEGIMLHRAIDRFTDDHPVFLQVKKLLSPERRRFAGIVIDIFFDHFLAIHWEEFGEGSLEDFIEQRYLLLEKHDTWLTPELREIVPRMRDEDWLAAYEDQAGLALTFRRISKRRDWLTPIVGAEEDLYAHYVKFEEAFLKFYPEAVVFSAGLAQ